MKRFLAVLLEYEKRINPEPGVPRAPTFGEQATALERLAERLGGILLPTPYLARQGQGVRSNIFETLDAERCDGVLIFAIEAIRHESLLDTRLVAELHRRKFLIGLLIENMVIEPQSDVKGLLDFSHVVNSVRVRDRSEEWRDLVASQSKL